ncbi:MAG: glutathione S-transferase [Nitrosomonas ureae]
MQNPLLYTYRRCPYAMRARMALLVAGIAFDAYEVSLRDKPAEMLALSAKGSVPVMLLSDGQVLEQSWDIMQWALSQQGVDGCWASAQTPENLEWLAKNDGDFKFHLDRYKYPDRYENVDRNSHREAAFKSFLLPLNARLERIRFLGGEQPCATDIAIFPFVRQFAAVEPGWFAQQAMPSLQSWLSNWLSSDLFLHCMHKPLSQVIVKFPQPANRSDFW